MLPDATTPLRMIVAIQRLGYVGGQEKSTLEVLRRLAQKGWQIELFSFDLSDWPPSLPLTWRRAPRLPLSVQLLQNFWFLCLAWLHVLRSRWHARAAGEAAPVVLTIGTAAPWADVRVIQFVHGAVLAILRQGLVPYPNASSPMRRVYQQAFARVEALVEYLLMPRCSELIAIADTVAREIHHHARRPAASVTVIHHAPEPFTMRPAPTAQQAVPTVLFVGALERKGIDKALRCLGLVADLPWRFQVVGGGDLKRWRTLATSLGIGERCEFLGQTPATAYFASASVFLFPSVYEPFGLVVTEAISHGLAPLVSRECGAMELWPNRADWLDLSAQASDEAWAASLRRLLASSAQRRQTVAAVQAAAKLWSWDQAAERYDAVLRRVATRSGRSARTQEKRAA